MGTAVYFQFILSWLHFKQLDKNRKNKNAYLHQLKNRRVKNKKIKRIYLQCCIKSLTETIKDKKVKAMKS